MFGFGDQRYVRQITDGTLHLVRLLDTAGIGQPAGFWRDPYVLGFLFGTATVLGHISSKGALRGERGGKVALQVIENVAGHMQVQARTSLLEYLRSKNEIFLDAGRIAAQLVDFAYGNPVRAADIDFDTALAKGAELALALDGNSDPVNVRQYAYSVLAEDHWFSEVRERLM